MSATVVCNICGEPVRYIINQREGTQKCDPTHHTGVTDRGRIVEVYLLHECHKPGTPDEVFENEDEKRGSRLVLGTY